MEAEVPYYLHKILDGFESRRRKNSAYSLRAYSRFLDIQPASLSAIFKQKRRLPIKVAGAVAAKLQLSPMETERFVNSIRGERKVGIRQIQGATRADHEFKLLDEEAHYHIISQWEHYAIYSLVSHPGFQADSDWIARKLDISPVRAHACLDRLLTAGLLRRTGEGKLERCHNDIATTDNINSQALMKSHAESLELAASKLAEIPMTERDYSSATFSFDQAQMTAVRDLIRRFTSELVRLAEAGSKEEVYHLAIQLFPLTVPDQDRGI